MAAVRGYHLMLRFKLARRVAGLYQSTCGVFYPATLCRRDQAHRNIALSPEFETDLLILRQNLPSRHGANVQSA
ncbi:hypothetical protein KCP71_07420 [Salmonella enterica subsp. enterica]|nr:hypothetical protein KCP71_07420 [Salmonella enterica subsp. enterica]